MTDQLPDAALLTVGEVSKTYRVPPSTVYSWVQRGDLVHFRVGRLIRIRREDLEDFLERSLNGNGQTHS